MSATGSLMETTPVTAGAGSGSSSYGGGSSGGFVVYMLDYLVARPEKGLLAYEIGIPTIVQYWKSFEQLEAFGGSFGFPTAIWRPALLCRRCPAGKVRSC